MGLPRSLVEFVAHPSGAPVALSGADVAVILRALNAVVEDPIRRGCAPSAVVVAFASEIDLYRRLYILAPYTGTLSS